MSVLLATPPLKELELILFPAPSPAKRAEESPRSEDGLYVSKETYWREYYDHADLTYEWNNGRLEEKTASRYVTTKQYNWLKELLQIYLRVHEIGELVNLKMGFEFSLTSGERVRIPDLGVILNDNPVPIKDNDNRYHGTFDLCIEAISDSTRLDAERDTIVKKKEYAEADVKEYYILDGTGFETAFYRLNQQGEYERIKPTSGGVIQSEVLPGFQFRIADLYRQPTPREMVTDKVYRGFIMLDYQAEKERADFAMQRAYEEKLRADEEKQRAEEQKRRADEERQRAEEQKRRADEAIERAERLAAKLRELGIELD